MEEAITQLLRYANAREWMHANEGVERLFHYNQVMIATCWYEARVATVGASYEHYLEWKDTSPVPPAGLAHQGRRCAYSTGASCSYARSATGARSTSSSGMPGTVAPGSSTASSSLLRGSASLPRPCRCAT
jgi:hypothetical protein